MRIAIYHNLPSGGAKRTLYESVKRLSTTHSFDLYVPETAERNFCDVSEYVADETIFPYARSPRLGSPFGRLNNGLTLYDLWRLRRVEQLAARLIDREGYDLALVHPSQWTQAPSILRYLRTPSLYYCHEPLRHVYERLDDVTKKKGTAHSIIAMLDPFPRLLDRTIQKNDRRATRTATMVATNSRFTARQIREVYEIDAEVAYHGIDTALFQPYSVAREPFVLSVGALMPHKGYGFLIRSLARIEPASRPPLVIVSNVRSSDVCSSVATLATDLDVDVSFRYQVRTVDLVDLYNRCSLFLYGTHREPFGLALLEAMACGAPVVAVREGGPCETVVDGDTGILVPRDEELFADAVATLLAHPERRASLSRRAVDYVRERWTWERAVQRLEDLMVQTAARGRG